MSLLAAIGWRVVPRIDLGPVAVSPHGLGIALGFAAGGAWTARRAERLHGYSREHIWNALMWAVVGVVVGSRLFYVVGHFDEYWPNLVDIVKVWEGGIVFYGGVFGGIAAAIPTVRKHGYDLWKSLDATAPGFPLGLAIGRIGDLVIGDHLGGLTDQPWGFRYEGGELPDCPLGPPDACVPGMVFHQTALYDWVNAIILLGVVSLVMRRRRPDGFLIMFTATWYAAGRLASDFGRSAPTYAGLRGTQWVSVALILAGIAFMVRLAVRARRAAAAPEERPSLDDILAAEMVAEGAPIWEPDETIDPGVGRLEA